MKLQARDIWHLYHMGALMGQAFKCVKELPNEMSPQLCKGKKGTVVGTNQTAGLSPTCLYLLVALKNNQGMTYYVHLKPRQLAKFFELVAS